MRSTRPRSRTLAALLGAGLLSLALAASAAAVAFVYDNKFGSRGEYKEIKPSEGGKRSCERSYRKESNQMRVRVSAGRLCEFAPPVTGDGGRPDHVAVVDAKVLSRETLKRARDAAYIAVRVRSGSGSGGFYELQVYPKGREFKLSRAPDSALFPIRGESRAIEGLDSINEVSLAVTGDEIVAEANGEELARLVDPDSGELDGREVSFGLGSTKDRKDGPVGAFSRVRVGVPDP